MSLQFCWVAQEVWLGQKKEKVREKGEKGERGERGGERIEKEKEREKVEGDSLESYPLSLSSSWSSTSFPPLSSPPSSPPSSTTCTPPPTYSSSAPSILSSSVVSANLWSEILKKIGQHRSVTLLEDERVALEVFFFKTILFLNELIITK